MYLMFTMCSKLRPSMMLNLIRRLVFDVSLLNEHIKMPLKVIIQKKVFNLRYRISNINITLCINILSINHGLRFGLMYFWLSSAADQSLWALLEVLLFNWRLGKLWSCIRWRASSHQEALLGDFWCSLTQGEPGSWALGADLSTITPPPSHRNYTNHQYYPKSAK